VAFGKLCAIRHLFPPLSGLQQQTFGVRQGLYLGCGSIGSG
jgi:hypothetical protein